MNRRDDDDRLLTVEDLTRPAESGEYDAEALARQLALELFGERLARLAKEPARQLHAAAGRILLRKHRKMQAARRRGGDAKRGTHKCQRIFEWIVRELESDPKAKNQNLADRFPEDGMHLYLNDEGRFVDDGNGKLSRHGFNRYVTDARKGLGIARRPSSRTT